MDKYFRLNAHCHLEGGLTNGCIYNLINGNMIILDSEKYTMLKMCEENIPLEDIKGMDYEFIHKLQEMNLGLYYNTPVYIDKFEVGTSLQLESVITNNHEINTAFIELDTACNFDCIFCKKDDNVLFRKTGCKRWSVADRITSLDDWKNIMMQLAELSCKRLIFLGGEPFLKKELVMELCVYAINLGIRKIAVYTNGSCLDEEVINFLKKFHIEVYIQIVGYEDETYEMITGKPNMGNMIFDSIRKLAEQKIDYRLVYLVNRYNDKMIESTFERYSEFTSYKQMETEFIYPIPSNEFYSQKYQKLMYDKKGILQKAGISVGQFCNARKQHNCYGHQIAIAADGNVLPCIMSRNFVLGNVKQEKVSDILCSKNYEYYRRRNKDTVEHCKSCALKYGCFDCRALEYSATGKIDGLEYCDI